MRKNCCTTKIQASKFYLGQDLKRDTRQIISSNPTLDVWENLCWWFYSNVYFILFKFGDFVFSSVSSLNRHIFFCQHIFTAIKFVSWKVQRRHVYCIISLTCSLVSFLHYNSPLVLRSSFLVHFKCVGNIEETLSAQYLASYWIIFEVSTSSGEHLGWIIFDFEVWMG